jgi:ubiquitin-protein ligase
MDRPATDRAANRRKLIAVAQYKAAIKEPSEYIKYHITEEDVNTWYALIHNFSGNTDEYVGGEYLFKIMLPEEFPMVPPKFFCLTPNGLYGIDAVVCISIGEYHPEEYRPSLGVRGFIINLVSGLVGWREMTGGIKIKETTAKEKLKLAKLSRSANYANYPIIMKNINDAYDGYSKLWNVPK